MNSANSGGFREIRRGNVMPTSGVSLDSSRSFPVLCLPRIVAQFIRQAALAIGCDESFVALPLVAVLAGLIGNHRRIRLKPDWSEPCVIWAALIAESGDLKSPAQDKAVEAVRTHQRRFQEEYDLARKDYEKAVLRYGAQLHHWKKNPDGDPPNAPEEPHPRRLLIDDITIEAVVAVLSHNPWGLTLTTDELSTWFTSFDAYRQGRGGDVGKWLTMHGARPLVVDRKGSGHAHVPHAAVSITGSIQPEILRRVLSFDHIEDGLAARFLLAMPPRKRKRWSNHRIKKDTWQGLNQIVSNLVDLDRIDRERTDPLHLDLTPGAQDLWRDFFDEWAGRQADVDGPLAAAYSKLEGYAARLALVIHMVRWASGELSQHASGDVDEVSLQSGIDLVRWFAAEAERVYDFLELSEDERKQRRLVEWIHRRGGSVTARDLARGPREYRESTAVAENALHGLVTAGLGRWEESGSHTSGGRPTRRLVLTDAAPPGDTTSARPRENEVSSPSPPTDDSATSPLEPVVDDDSLAPIGDVRSEPATSVFRPDKNPQNQTDGEESARVTRRKKNDKTPPDTPPSSPPTGGDGDTTSAAPGGGGVVSPPQSSATLAYRTSGLGNSPVARKTIAAPQVPTKPTQLCARCRGRTFVKPRDSDLPWTCIACDAVPDEPRELHVVRGSSPQEAES